MAPTAFQIISDLHLETQPSYSYAFKQTAPNLALLGDIGNIVDDGLFTFLETQLRRYWNVFYVMGNHEPCHTSWQAAKQMLREFADKVDRLRSRSTLGRFIFLDQTRYDVDEGLTVLGCTLFSKISQEQATAVSSRFVDFRLIQNWAIENHVDAHISDVKWLNEQVKDLERLQPHRQVIVFTHYSPCVDHRAVEKRHAGSSVSSGFVTDLSDQVCWNSKSVVLWGFGHSHYSCDFDDEFGKRVVANQRGYAAKLEDSFDAGKLFVVGTANSAGLI